MCTLRSQTAASDAPRAVQSWAQVSDALVRSGEWEWPGAEFDDGFSAIDYTAYINGLGRAVITNFVKATFGPSSHTVALVPSGEVHQLKLRRRGNREIEWLVGERAEDRSSLRSAALRDDEHHVSPATVGLGCECCRL